ncbi:DUF3987 domain-containing protein [Vibrio astriarenae]|uniref:DUF3987 domain-containing protein n=1 Tax=Vibrio astriarenae TaxID=1481923 RepID=A0A7Z2YE56_9VIBR|nr:DUF3987 domain-containing protein [Vibrio astriarenae]QIA64021.1 DUF3987 domain-containing protein [Vibrio astriarenae]
MNREKEAQHHYQPLEQLNKVQKSPAGNDLAVTIGSHHKQAHGFSTITYDGICDQIKKPLNLTHFKKNEIGKLISAKANCPWFMATDCPSRAKQSVAEHNEFKLLIVDLDTGDWVVGDLVNALKYDHDISSFAIYSTISSVQNTPRWRVIVPLLYAVDLPLWTALQESLAKSLGGDLCAINCNQIAYLPALSELNSCSYQYHIETGALIDGQKSKLVDSFETIENTLAPKKQAQEHNFTKSLSTGQISPIDQLEASTSWDNFLLYFGFKKVGKRWLHPDSQSGSPGVTISYRDDRNGRYLSAHESDPLNDGYSHSKFDVYCHFEHNGDTNIALKALGDKMLVSGGATINQHNKKLFNQANQPVPIASVSTLVDATNSNKKSVSEKIQEILDSDHIRGCVNITQYAPDNLIFKFSASLAKSAQFPQQTAALIALASFSSAANGSYAVQYRDGSSLSLGLYAVSEQPPGSSKSRVLNTTTRAIRSKFAELRKLAIDSVSCDADLSNDDESKQKPRVTIPYLTDTTPEALEQKLAHQGGYFGIASAEQASIDTLLGTNLDRKNNNDVILKAYTGNEQHVSCRVGRNGYSGSPYGSVNVIAQEGTIESILAKSNGQGIAERFLMISEPNMLGHRQYTEYTMVDPELSTDFDNLASNLVMAHHKLKPESIDDLNTLCINVLGWELIDKYRARIEPRLADGEKYSHSILRGAFSKADIQIMKISALLHLSGPRKDKAVISDVEVEQAIGVVNELLNNLYNIMEAKGIIGLKAEYTAILACFDKNRFRTERQLIESRKKVKPFVSMTKKNDAIRMAIKEMLQGGLLTQTIDDKSTIQLSMAQ